ncbi:formate dehydrogenase accessory protein FdhE [uncultured Desulfovibrio sp.]|uniref:formate dehydrogenase accessory protein FdhE n=1 Tax=uncultured Desulfovibrio sp. TaxID=167968 RepID=UPI0026142500|nr:formate dehydrogenase accessory protein FdhE [uncultured Desulfovibrio sp.]
MGETCLSVSETLADIAARRPALKPVLEAFRPLLETRAALTAGVREDVAALTLPPFSLERASQGVPLMAGLSLRGLAAPLRTAAQRLLPLLCALEPPALHRNALEALFLQEGTASEQLVEALISGNSPDFQRLASEAGIPPEVLSFALEFIAAPAMRALASRALPAEGDAPWNGAAVWTQGYCPVCGSLPVIATLDKSVFDEKNAFLAGGGGKKRLHCGLCATSWTFRRSTCPACGKQGNEVMEILRESEGANGERLDWCVHCKTYCPTVDLREREAVPDMDAMALGMLHLDMVASRRGLHPLRPSFWNIF